MRAGIECETLLDEGDPADVLGAASDRMWCRSAGNRQQGDEASRARQRPEHSHAQGRLLGDGRQDDVSELPHVGHTLQ